jgi:hypothetical protein
VIRRERGHRHGRDRRLVIARAARGHGKDEEPLFHRDVLTPRASCAR